MNRIRSALIPIVALASMYPSTLIAEGLTRAEERDVKAAIKNLEKENPSVEIERSPKSLPESVEGVSLNERSPDEPSRPAEDVQEFLETNKSLFLDPEYKIVSQTEDPAVPGRAIVRVQQLLNGITILGAEAIFFVDPEENNLSVEATLLDIPPIPTDPKISREYATTQANIHYAELLKSDAELQASENALDPEELTAYPPELIVVRPSDVGGDLKDYHLAWKINVGSFIFFVDAGSGELLGKYREYHTALTRRTFDLAGGVTFPGSLTLWDNPAPPPVANPTQDARSAHDNAKLSYDFFFENFSRDGIDNKGGEIVSYVRHRSTPNARWSKKRKAIIYGPGFSLALDVAVHEMTHGIIASSSQGLVNIGEPGALNEFFADLFGALAQGDWEIGEVLPGFTPPARPIRSLADPHNGGFVRDKLPSSINRGQPEQMPESVRKTHKICALEKLSECAHLNSGIWGKAAYLATEGGTHNGRTIQGIGREKIAQVFYTTMLSLPATASFSKAAETTLTICTDMAAGRSHGVSDEDCQELKKALQAVEVFGGN